MTEIIFDRELLFKNRLRAINYFQNHNFLYHEIANRIAENLSLLNRNFESVLEIGALDDYLKSQILKNHQASYFNHDDSENLNLKNSSFDLILSNLDFHFINQIPQFLLQVKKLLKADGVFIASFFGEENLSELAHVLYKSEMEIYNGVSPRMAPTIDVKTAAALLQKAGFVDPISDFEKIEVSYSNPINLLKDLKMMGQGNILVKRSRRFFTKKFLERIVKNYQELYPLDSGEVNATFEIVTITGWNK